MSRREIVQPEDLEDRSQDAAFVRARGGESFFSPVYFGPEAEPYMHLAVPIEPFPGDVVGVLSAEVRLTYIRDVIAQVVVGQAGYAYVVSAAGDLRAHHDLSLVLQKRNLKHLTQVQMALDGTPGPFVAQPNLAGQRVFAAYAPIPSLGWVVLVERPVSEAYAPLYGSINRSLAVWSSIARSQGHSPRKACNSSRPSPRSRSWRSRTRATSGRSRCGIAHSSSG